MRLFSIQTVANRPTTQYYQQPSSFQMHLMPVSQPHAVHRYSLPPPPVEPKKETSKMLWGEPTWLLFHVLSYKIKEESFSVIREELLGYVYAICCNLPCPVCAEHAKTYMQGINFATIRTKEDFKKMMFVFHNVVNQRKGYALFDYAEFDSKYSNAVTNRIIQNFMYFFEDRKRGFKLVASDLYRKQLIERLKSWFNANIHHFLP